MSAFWAFVCTLSCHSESLGLYAQCKTICSGTRCWINHFFFSVSLSGVQVQCNSCKTSANPQYHLAMSDGSVRNFCSYNCVVAFQVWYLGFLLSSINSIIHQISGVSGKMHKCKIRLFFPILQNLFNKPAGVNSSVVPLSQGQVIVSIPSGTTVSAGGTTSTASPSSGSSSAAAGLQRLAAQSQQVTFARKVVKLWCQHCNRLFATKPELLDFKVIKTRTSLACLSRSESSEFITCTPMFCWYCSVVCCGGIWNRFCYHSIIIKINSEKEKTTEKQKLPTRTITCQNKHIPDSSSQRWSFNSCTKHMGDGLLQKILLPLLKIYLDLLAAAVCWWFFKCINVLSSY